MNKYFVEKFQQIYIHIGLINTMYLNKIYSRLVNFPALLGRQTFFELKNVNTADHHLGVIKNNRNTLQK